MQLCRVNLYFDFGVMTRIKLHFSFDQISRNYMEIRFTFFSRFQMFLVTVLSILKHVFI